MNLREHTKMKSWHYDQIAPAAAGACCSRNEISRERNQEIVEYLKRCNEANTTPEVPADVRHEYDNPQEITWDRSRKPLPFKIRNYS